jgi:hypothetical protein
METQGIQAHGAAHFITESMLDRGDDYYMAVCNKTGLIAIYNENKNIFVSPYADGPLKFTEAYDTNLEGLKLKHVTKHGRDFSIVRIPYCFKLLMQELQTMNIQMRIITDDNIDQLMSMSYSNNVNKLLSIDDLGIKQIKQNTKKKLQQNEGNPMVLVKTPDGEKQGQQVQQEEVRQQEAAELLPTTLPVLPAKDYAIGEIVYYIEDVKKQREWIIEELDEEYDAVVIVSDDMTDLNDEMNMYVSQDRLIATVESEQIRKKGSSQTSVQNPLTALIPQAITENIPNVLNETIDTAQQTINNAQQTIQTAQKRITDNLNAIPSISPPFNAATPTSPGYSPVFNPNAEYSPPFNPNAEYSPPFNPNAEDSSQQSQFDLEKNDGNETKIIKKEGYTEQNKKDEDTNEKPVEKMTSGNIMNDALPTLTNIFETFTGQN